nr:MAG TPA: hypothetical protein [Caudoviricetes sp.]DAW76923.1 MAG TPA: hypothetical protein [Caudoviricetes sp.]DAY56367.1 MAG TPA: hypothetical protein [Caudoviricetes sp.]DAY75928.1 MAG TPA: hypothetical protein [Caudoviricetes sp.]DAY93654.1 MAG TPA: hypothetical protein [Caudoviricetes sp.]
MFIKELNMEIRARPTAVLFLCNNCNPERSR